MANPNLISTTIVRGKSTILDLTTTAQTLLTNATASNTLVKINSITAINRGNNLAEVSIFFSKNASPFTIANRIGVPSKSNLIIFDKEIQLYLEENDSLTANSSIASTLTLVCSYEILQ